MSGRTILSEKPEDNNAAAEWGVKQAELIRKGEEITKRLTAKYIPVILSHNMQGTISSGNSRENSQININEKYEQGRTEGEFK